MTLFVLGEGRLDAYRLDRFEKIEHAKRDEMIGTYRDYDGSLRTINLDASATRIEVLGCPVIPATPGHYVLRPASLELADVRLHRISVVGWHVTSVCAFPVTVDSGSSATELYSDAIEFPDGHVEYINQRFDSVEDCCRSFGRVPPEQVATHTPEGTLIN